MFVILRKLEFTLSIAFKLNSPCDLLKPRHVKAIPNCLVGSRSIRQLSDNTILPKSLQECFALSIYLAFNIFCRIGLSICGFVFPKTGIAVQ